MYHNNEWVPEFYPGDEIKTDYNIIKIISVYQEQIYNVEIAGDHGVHKAKLTEQLIKDIK